MMSRMVYLIRGGGRTGEHAAGEEKVGSTKQGAAQGEPHNA